MVKVVSLSLCSVWGGTAELRVPPHEEEGTRATHSLTGPGRSLREFFWVRCGRVKVVSLAFALYGVQRWLLLGGVV